MGLLETYVMENIFFLQTNVTHEINVLVPLVSAETQLTMH